MDDIFQEPRIVRRRARTSPRTGGAEEVDVLGIAMPDGDFLPLVGVAYGPQGDGPASFREPGVARLHKEGVLLMLRIL
ncbi:hypothetical protein HRbin24_00100 [bacterium HR24]|nr:hypothetical protein HRbin24_00100 [bacterium HR24]